MSVLLFGFVLGSSGCGGGGSGGDDGGDDELQYVGNTSPAVISAVDATRLVSNIFSVGYFTDQQPIPGLSAAPGRVGAASRVASTAREVRSAGISLDETEPCYATGATDPTGSVTLEGSLSDRDGTGTLTLTYRGCQEGDTYLDGVVTWRIDEALLTPEVWEPRDSTFTFHTVTLISSDFDVLLGGTLRVQLADDRTETTTLDVVSKDNNTERMQKTERLVIVSEPLSVSQISVTITGRFYDSVDGYVDVTTPLPLIYDGEDSVFPSTGRLQIAGANSAQLRVTALSEVMTLVELDLDNDTDYETAGEIPWEVIADAGDDPGDIDGDGLLDSWEAPYGLSNATYADASTDVDADGLSNYEEYVIGTDPTNTDSDSDGMADGWEAQFGFDPTSDLDAALDLDGDIATNLQEYEYGTDPATDTSTPADLAVSATSLATVSAQTLFEYRLSVNNLGPGLARGVRVTYSLPEGAQIYMVAPGIMPPSPWDCTLDEGSLSCAPMMGVLAVGGDVTIVVPVIAPATPGEVINSATVESSTLDFDGANDTATDETTLASAVLAQVDVAIDGVDGVDGLEFPFRLALSHDGKHVYVPGIYDDAVAVFARDLAAGTLTFVEAERENIDTPGMPDFPKAVAVSPDGSHVYVTTEWSDGEWVGSVVAYRRDAASGELDFVAEYRDGVDGVDGIAQAIDLTVSGDGENVYVAGPNDNAVAIFDRDAITGQLTYSEAFVDGVGGVDGLAGAFDVALSPDDEYLYVGGSLDNAIAVFRRGDGGALTYINSLFGVYNPQSIEVSSDGKHLYALGGDPGTLTRGLSAFVRNMGDGTLTPLATYSDGTGGIIGLDGMYGLAIAPNGENVYVAAQPDSALGVFARDAATGELRFIEVQKDRIGAVDELGGAWAVAVSPDSGFLYVSGGSDNALSAFHVDLSAER